MLFCTAKMNMRLLHESERKRLNEGTFRSVKCNICWSTAAKSRKACDVHAFVWRTCVQQTVHADTNTSMHVYEK